MRLPSVLSIAGSDSSGGAGIQADLKTALANGVFGMSAVTALTAQNTMGVTGIHEVPPEFLAGEIDAVFADIRPDAVKVGMVASAELIRTIAERLLAHGAAHIVVDPVIVATSGARLLAEDAANALAEKLFPLAEVITPNLPELFVLDQLTGGSPASVEDYDTLDARVEAAKRVLKQFGAPDEQHPRYRMHAFHRHRLKPRERHDAPKSSGTRESLRDRRARRGPRYGRRQRPAAPRLRHRKRIYRDGPKQCLISPSPLSRRISRLRPASLPPRFSSPPRASVSL